jgi:hypothetical protein
LAARRQRRTITAATSVGGSGFLVQYFAGHYYRGPSLTLADVGLVALVLAGAAVAVEILGRIVPLIRAALRARRNKRRRLRAAAGAEVRARALMAELCPQGWRAQITLFDAGGVALDWAELEDDGGRVAVVRRVWAPTIAEALEAMVADRRTDETLEQIERGASGHDAAWPDLYL